MKKITRKMLIMAGIIAILRLVNACSGDEEGNTARDIRFEKELDDIFLTGDWEYESITADIPEDYNGDGIKSTDILLQSEEKRDDIIRFIPIDHQYEIWHEGFKHDRLIEQGTYTIEEYSNKITMISEDGERGLL